MAHKDLQAIVRDWIQDDGNVKAKWEIQETEENQVVVTGILMVTIDTNVYKVTGSSRTTNDDESIGRAMQAINDGILNNLYNKM